jgi:hypothetical protein
MNTIEATAIMDEDQCHFTLVRPLALPVRPKGPVKVTFQFEDPKPDLAPVDFREAIGEMHRVFPDAPRISSDEWMKILREGDED